MAARKYKVETCPIHGPEKMRGGSIGDQRARCFAVAKRTADRVTYCYETETVTAYDARDVDPLVQAAARCLPENDSLEELGFREVPGSRLRALAAALAQFDREESQ